MTCVATLCAACGGAQTAPAQSEQEVEAERILARARERSSADDYRDIVDRFGQTRAAPKARAELADLLLGQANGALAARRWKEAEESAEEARVYGSLEQTERARALVDAADDGYAAEIGQQAAALAAAEGGCNRALAHAAGPLKKKVRPRFRQAVQERSSAALVACVSAEVESQVRQGAVAQARGLLATPDATLALSAEAHRALTDKLSKLLAARTLEQLGPLLNERKFDEVIAKLDRERASGELGETEYAAAFEAVRERIAATVLERLAQGRRTRKPAELAAEVDALTRIAKWKNLPESIVGAKRSLAVSLECERLKCRPQKPAEVWAWGTISVQAPEAADGPEVSKLAHAERVWIVARSPARVLVATSAPAGGADDAALQSAAGWVDPKNLKATPTTGWLPPDGQLIGVRVWGPFHESSTQYSLGIITSVEGKSAKVQRLSDSKVVTAELGALRMGDLPVGLKVLAFCADRFRAEPAKVQGPVVKDRNVDKVEVVCERGGQKRMEVVETLSVEPAWLPPRKP